LWWLVEVEVVVLGLALVAQAVVGPVVIAQAHHCLCLLELHIP
jgi:hypothetical protein